MNIGNTHAINGSFQTEALSVVCCQCPPRTAETAEDVDFNVEQILDYMDRGAAGFPGYDLFVAPECGLQGFGAGWKDVLLAVDGPEVKKLCDKCNALGVWGIFGLMATEYRGNKVCNLALMINDRGEVVHIYSKNNPWIPGEGTYPGTGCPVTPGPKGSRIATIICSDGDYPEIWREAAVNGANLIVRIAYYPSPWEQAWEITNRAGAYCNQVYVCAVNAVGMNDSYAYFGRSMILSPDGTVIVDAPRGVPWITKANIYPSIVDQMRKKEVTGNYIYSYRNRGASHPDRAGEGLGFDGYHAYRR